MIIRSPKRTPNFQRRPPADPEAAQARKDESAAKRRPNILYRILLSVAGVAFLACGLLVYSYASGDWRLVNAITSGPKKLLGIKDKSNARSAVYTMQEFTLNDSGTVVVTATGADVLVSRSAVRSFDVVYTADTLNGERYDITPVITPDTLRLNVAPASGFRPPAMVRARITVNLPSLGALLLNVKFGSVHITGLSGHIQANATSGGIALKNVNGTLDLSAAGGNVELTTCRAKGAIGASGGSIKITEHTGDLHAQASSDITASRYTGTLDARSQHGNLSADFLDRRPSCVAQADTGNVTLGLLPNARVTLNVFSALGRITNTLQLDSVPEATAIDRRRLRTTMNGGGGTVTAHTNVGAVNLKQYGAPEGP